MVLTDPEEVDADPVGKDTLLDEVPDRLGVRERPVIIVVRVTTPNVSSPKTIRNGRGVSVS